MSPPTANDVRVFVPAKDFGVSLKFYEELGWYVNWKAEDDALAEIELADRRFYLQNYYAKEWAENFMIHVAVEDAHEWKAHASKVIEDGEYGAARVEGPREEHYGALVTYVWDPSGVLLHFAQFLEA